MSDNAPHHPEARTMVAFIEGRLGADELASVTAHLRGCRDCRTVVTETAYFDEDERQRAPASPAPRRIRAAWWLAAAALFATIFIAVPLYRLRRPATPIAQLIAVAPRQHRSVEARLSGFPWARLQAPSRGDAIPDPADLRLAGAAGNVLEQTSGRQEPQSRHVAGVAYLLIGRAHESIAALAQAASRSNDAATWNDLAAARYAAAMSEERPSQLVDALADVDHALRIDPKLAEARFNRALILERMGIGEKAREAWQEFLELEPASAWSVEARAHLRVLARQSEKFDPALLANPTADLARRFPQETRKYGEGPMLCDWAAAERAGDRAGAAGVLARVRFLANALASLNGERLLDDAVAAIERANDAQRAALAEAHTVFGAARKAYGTRRGADAEAQLRRAAMLFANGGSPMADVARYYAASAAFDQNRGPDAREQLLLLRGRIDRSRHRALSAQIGWTLAVIANSISDAATGAREADAAATIFRALGERTNEAFVDGIAAQALELTGNADAAWTRRIRSLTASCGGADRQRCNGILDDAAAQLTSLDRSDAALALTGATSGGIGNDPFADAMQSVNHARVAIRAGDEAVARDAVDHARAAATRISDRALREAAETQIEIEHASLERGADPHHAIDSLTRSAAFLGSHDVGYLLPYVYLQRARAFRTARNEPAALADYRAAMTEIRKQESRITEPNLRLAFLDTARQVIDETIELQLSRGDVGEAFRVAGARHQLRPDPAAPRLPAGVAAIEYAVLPHAVVIFFLTGDAIVARRVDVDRHELEMRIDAFVSAIRRRASMDEVRASSSVLDALLIAPIRSQLAGIDQLVIVPDRQLFAIPFAALYDEKSGRYLMDELEIRFAPALASSTATTNALAPALVVADPLTSRPRLRGGRDEAERIASLHGATLLAGDAATRARFIDAARQCALIHFTGHAESDAIASDGALLLAGGDALGENDVARMQLDRHPLVVLAACGTFRGDPMHVAGMSSLARAFLIAGARAVVGTLWEVEDDAAAALFLRFHENLRAGASPARALRDAQRAMLHSSDPRLKHPATWASAELLGGTI
jgi:CHAT domain-containing protein